MVEVVSSGFLAHYRIFPSRSCFATAQWAFYKPLTQITPLAGPSGLIGLWKMAYLYSKLKRHESSVDNFPYSFFPLQPGIFDYQQLLAIRS